MTQARYVIANAAGDIIRTVVCDEVQAACQAQATETLIQHDTANNMTHYVVEGVVTEYTGEQVLARAVRPSYACHWDNASMAFVDERTTEQMHAETISEYEAAAQKHLDSFAASWGYDGLNSAASYVASTVGRFKAEAEALVAWRDAVWVAAYDLETFVVNGTETIPATAADFIALLPAAPNRPIITG
jgi:hypothetical protein